jgi:DnaJ family protein C protein 17
MLDDLEERERVLKKTKLERREEEVKRWADTERVKDEGKRMMEEREKEIRMREEEAERTRMQADEEDIPPVIGAYTVRYPNFILIYSTGALDTTIRLKYTLNNHPTITTPASLKSLLSPFGPTDEALMFLSLKPPKKHPDKPAKYATAIVPFNKIGDAFAAVCASGREERGLKGIEVGWAGDKEKEPEIIGWLRRKGKLGANGQGKSASKSTTPTADGAEVKADTPQSKTRPSESSAYSSFPSSFVRAIYSYRYLHANCIYSQSNLPTSAPSPPPSSTKPVAAGLDYESLTLMRLRQGEREKLEREILEQEANA